jgi:hypothetical protein
VIELALLFAHTTGGRPAERLMRRLGVPQSDDILLRSLKPMSQSTAVQRLCGRSALMMGVGETV